MNENTLSSFVPCIIIVVARLSFLAMDHAVVLARLAVGTIILFVIIIIPSLLCLQQISLCNYFSKVNGLYFCCGSSGRNQSFVPSISVLYCIPSSFTDRSVVIEFCR